MNLDGFSIQNDWLTRKLADLTAEQWLRMVVAANVDNLASIEGQTIGTEESQLSFSSDACTANAGNVALEVVVPRGDLIRDIYLRIPRVMEKGINTASITDVNGLLTFYDGQSKFGDLPVVLNGIAQTVKQFGGFAGQRPTKYSVAFGFPSSKTYDSSNALGTNSAASPNGIMVLVSSSAGGAPDNIYIPVTLSIRCNITRIAFTLANWQGTANTGNDNLLAFLGVLSRAR